MERFGNFSSFLLILCIALLPALLFVIAMYRTMNSVAPQNRKIPAWAVWLLLLPIPIIGNILWLIVPYKYSQSIEVELKERGIAAPKYPTLFAGMAVGITQLLAYLPFMHWFTRYAWFIFFFFYWYKIVEYKRKLESPLPQTTL